MGDGVEEMIIFFAQPVKVIRTTAKKNNRNGLKVLDKISDSFGKSINYTIFLMNFTVRYWHIFSKKKFI